MARTADGEQHVAGMALYAMDGSNESGAFDQDSFITELQNTTLAKRGSIVHYRRGGDEHLPALSTYRHVSFFYAHRANAVKALIQTLEETVRELNERIVELKQQSPESSPTPK